MDYEDPIQRGDRDRLAVLRREGDCQLLSFLEKALERVDERLVKVEELLMELRDNHLLRKGSYDAFEAFQERIFVRQEKHEERIGELEKSMAGLKAWILIVGGITGVAGFLAIVLR